MTSSDLFIGIMSGTSLDSIDTVLVEFDEGYPKLIATHNAELPENLRCEILTLNTSGSDEIERLASLDPRLASVFAESCLELLRRHNISPKAIKAIGSHGQTIRHRPEKGFSLQIGDPNIIAELTGITTIADFRRRDLAAGGQGAPLVPAFHYQCFQSTQKDRVIINIGGMANITLLPKESTGKVIGYDTGPGNVLLDYWAEHSFGKSYDLKGLFAKSGSINMALLDSFLAEPYFDAPYPKSTGRELFNAQWLSMHLQQSIKSEIKPEDVQSTLTELTATSIAKAILSHQLSSPEIYVCGGGSHNDYLLNRLANQLNLPVSTTETLGLHPDWVEACAFAWLAYRTLNHQSGNLPAVTGAKGERILGGIYMA